MTGAVGVILMEILTVTLANSTTAPPYRKRLNGAVVPCSHFPFRTHCARTIGAVAARLARLTLELHDQGQKTGDRERGSLGDI